MKTLLLLAALISTPVFAEKWGKDMKSKEINSCALGLYSNWLRANTASANQYNAYKTNCACVMDRFEEIYSEYTFFVYKGGTSMDWLADPATPAIISICMDGVK